MSKRLDRATNLGLAANIFLFILKAFIGIISNSIAILSEAINSLTDIISSVVIKYSVRISKQGPDKKHNFGHGAAQPLAAFIVATFAFVVAIKIIEEAIKRIIDPQELTISLAVFVILIVNIIIKIGLSGYQKKIGKIFNSAAIKAAAVDSINDVMASSIALIGVIFASSGLRFVDGIAAIFVAFFILKSGYDIAKENIDFLMGRSADQTLIDDICNRAIKVEGVKGMNDLRTYYVGDQFHIEIHIEVEKDLPTDKSHDIGKNVKYAVEKIDIIGYAFVHIDPV